MEADLSKAIDFLMEAALQDYAAWMHRCGMKPDYIAEQLAKYEAKFRAQEGSKYIKLIRDGYVWGFIVKVDNDKKFARGDILKAAGYNAPARNFARGNVFSGYGPNAVRWTGAF